MVPDKTHLLSDFGITPDSGRDAVPALKRALTACQGSVGATLVIPPGTYHLYPEQAARIHYGMSNTEPIHPRTVALPLCGVEEFSVQARGATFIYHGRMMPIVIDRSHGVHIEGLTIDAAVPSCCQCRIEAVEDNAIEITIEEDADVRLENDRLIRYGEGWNRAIWGHQIVHPDGSVVYNTGDNPLQTLAAVALDQGRFRLRKPAHLMLQAGMYLLLRSGWRDHSAIFICNSRDVTLNDVTIHYANGTGILGQRSENVTMQGCRVLPAPGRVYSTFADATHWSGMKGTLTIEDCQFAGHLDDAANVHGVVTVVQEIATPRSVVGRFAHWESVGLDWAEAGDRISFFHRQTLLPLATATVESFVPVDEGTFRLVLETDLAPEVVPDTAMENLTWNPAFTFRGNQVSRHRARGILVSTSGATVIENNRFRSPGAAIVIAGDANSWFESGAVRDVAICNNDFENCNTSPYGSGAAVIHIDPVIGQVSPDAPCFHRNIRIEGNRFQVFDTPFLAALSVDGLYLRDNTIVSTDAFPPRIKAPYGLLLDACRNVVIEGNQYPEQGVWRSVLPSRMDSTDIQGAEWQRAKDR